VERSPVAAACRREQKLMTLPQLLPSSHSAAELDRWECLSRPRWCSWCLS
jgi:hypothetical protein